MTLVDMVAAASVALSATAVAPRAMPAVHGAGLYPASAGRGGHGAGLFGRAGLRDGGLSPIAGPAGGWGRGRWGPNHGWSGHRHGRWDQYAATYPFWYGQYGDYGFDDGAPYFGPAGGPGPFGPLPPYGEGFRRGFGHVALLPAEALAPLAYGPGVHDGAYAYGYNGYAQTPALPAVYGAAGWASRTP